MMYIMVIAISFLILLLSVLLLKYKKLKSQVNSKVKLEDYNSLKDKYNILNKTYSEIVESLKNKPLRKGYYNTTLTSTDNLTKKVTTFHPIVFVDEIDRYTDGTCEVKITKIIPKISSTEQSHESVIKYVKDNFSPIKKISEITWMESETEIRESRKHKIENILKNINKDNQPEV